MFHVKHFLQCSEANQFSEKILELEHISNMYKLDMNAGIEPTNVGHPRAGCSQSVTGPARLPEPPIIHVMEANPKAIYNTG
jgi:hypothetical protein